MIARLAKLLLIGIVAAPVIGVALASLRSRPTWRRGLTAAVIAQLVMTAAFVLPKPLAFRGCSWTGLAQSDSVRCAEWLKQPYTHTEELRDRAQAFLLLAVLGTMTSLVIGVGATAVARRLHADGAT